MVKQSFEDVIKVLKKVRDECSSQLDSGALVDLDGAISTLETSFDHHQRAEEVKGLNLRALQGIAAVVSIVTNLRDFMK